MQVVNASWPWDLAVERAQKIQAYAFLVRSIQAERQPRPHVEPRSVTISYPAAPVVTVERTAPTTWDWYAIAQCETGGDWNMTGSVYSTGLGMMDEAIRENSSPDVADRELSGTATVAEIIATAESIAAKHGIHSWGCGQKLYP